MVRSSHGAAHDVASSHILQRGDVVMTGIGALAAVNLEGAGKVRLGPATTVRVFQTGRDLSIRLTGGALCVSAATAHIKIATSRLTLAVASGPADFNIENLSDGAKAAVYRGSVLIRAGGTPSSTYKAGEAFAAPLRGSVRKVSPTSLTRDFAALRCPDAAVVAQASPAPAAAPQQQAAPGGGGAGGIIGVLLGIAAIGAAAGHGGGGGGSSTPGAPAPGSLTISPSALTFAGPSAAQQPVAVSESNYSGPFTITAPACAAVATFNPAAGSGPAATFQVSPKGVGSCTATIADNHGGGQQLGVTVYGALTTDKSSLTFTDLGSAHSQQFTAFEPQYGGPIAAAAANCNNVASVAPAQANAPAAFTVTPIASGTCSVTLTDNHGGTVSVPVTVGPFGPVVAAPNTVSLTSIGATQSISVSEANYTGNFFVDAGSCAGIASVTGSSPSFVVTATAPGNCSLSITDGHGGGANVRIFITTGALALTPNTLQFPSGAGQNGSFTANDPACTFPGSISATVTSGQAVVTVSPSTPVFCLGAITFSVTTGTDGRATITVTDTAGGTAVVSVGVGTTPLAVKRHLLGARLPLKRSQPPTVHAGAARQLPAPERQRSIANVAQQPPSLAGPDQSFSLSRAALSLNLSGPGQSLTVGEPGYSSAFHAVSSDPSILTVTATCQGPTCALILTPLRVGSGTISVRDDRGDVRTVPFAVTDHKMPSMHPPVLKTPPSPTPPRPHSAPPH
ncbi:MAG: hypothetical protein GIW99_03435 [Candidatus Eremiobacteraeota bacterium]|nr:hypothetical protein [Candidatus Eremiobacteraeota bacterium]